MNYSLNLDLLVSATVILFKDVPIVRLNNISNLFIKEVFFVLVLGKSVRKFWSEIYDYGMLYLVY